MKPIVTPEQMRAIDQAAPEPESVLIERAGRGLAWTARRLLGGVYGRRVVAIAGPGNNGADARVAAQILAGSGVRVSVVDPSHDRIGPCDLVIDGAFGTGLKRPYHPPSVSDDVPVLAVDIPSGVDGLTGQRLGTPLSATVTATFAALKPGLIGQPGAELAGRVEVLDIGLDVGAVDTWLFDAGDAGEASARVVNPRPTVHKWNRGVLVVGGSAGMTGAADLASMAALRAGAGIVHCVLPGQSAPPPSEVVYRPSRRPDWSVDALAGIERFGAIVIGPGLGRGDSVAQQVRAVLAGCGEIPTVVDGDGLSVLGPRPRLGRNVILTPHDGEYARLFGHPAAADRFEAARGLANVTGATVLLKGPLTVVATPTGRCWAVNRGDSRLATAGSGDVLSGVIAAFAAAGVAGPEAAALGAWVHGESARRRPRVGMVASDLFLGLVEVMNDLAPEPGFGQDARGN